MSIKICPSVSKLEVDTHLRPNTYPSPIAGTLPPSVLTLLVCNFLTKLDLVFCYKTCSDLLWEKIVRVIEKIFEITWIIYSSSEMSQQFLATECFFNLFMDISLISKNRTIVIQIWKFFWDLEICMKRWKSFFLTFWENLKCYWALCYLAL